MKNAISSGFRQGAAKWMIPSILLTCLVIGVNFVDPVVRAFRETGFLYEGFTIDCMTAGLRSDALAAFLPVLALLPFGGSFADDVKSKFARFFLIRTDYGTYAVSRVIVGFLAGGLAVLAGALLTWGAMTVVCQPMEQTIAGMEPADLSELVDGCILLFLNAGLWSVVGLTMSTFMESKYISYASPFVLYYLLVILSQRYLTDVFLLDPGNWLTSDGWPFGVWGAGIFLLELSAVFAIVFVIRAVRRMKNL